jgi:hypothetical protein
MKAIELAKILLERPDLKVGIRKFGGDNKWLANKVTIESFDADVDSGSLISSDDGHGDFFLIDAIEDRK